jgi:TPR repeat protein
VVVLQHQGEGESISVALRYTCLLLRHHQDAHFVSFGLIQVDSAQIRDEQETEEERLSSRECSPEEDERGSGLRRHNCPFRAVCREYVVPWGTAVAAGFHLGHHDGIVIRSVREEQRECWRRDAWKGLGNKFYHSNLGFGTFSLGALPIQEPFGVSSHTTSIAASKFNALGIEALRELVDSTDVIDEGVDTAFKASPPHGVNLKIEDQRAEPELPLAFRPTSATATEHDVNSISFVERDLRMTGDRLLAQMEADLGLDLVLGGDLNSGMRLLKSAAREGNAEAAHNLAVAYQGRDNLSKAVKYYRKAARAGYAPSMVNLSLIYRRGLGGVVKDEAMADRLMEDAREAKANEATDTSITGNDCKSCTDNGWTGDSPRVVVNQDPESVYLLARAYHYGLSGCPVDKVYAMALYRSAADGGHKAARRGLAILRRELGEGSEAGTGEETEEDLESVGELFEDMFKSERPKLTRRISGDSGLGAVEVAMN